MGKILVIAEKPSVGRDIAKVLNCNQKGDGFLYNDTHIVSWAIGHLVSLSDPEEYDVRLKKWAMETLPIAPEQMKLKTLPNTSKQFNLLKKLMNDKTVDSLICATDSGREGELIFRYIYQLSGAHKPFQRLWISSMTDEAIREGFSRLKPSSEYDTLYESARCRSEADWLVGMNATRAFTIMYKVLLSVGRVQTPTLAIMVSRQKEIDAFTTQDYWEVQGDFGDYRSIWYDNAVSETKITDQDTAIAISNKVKGKEGYIKTIICEDKKQPFPQLYDLTELQRDANRRYGFSAQKTLNTAQSLYEKSKMITYPRTDSRYISDDMIPTLKPVLQSLNRPPYTDFVKPLLELTNLPVGKRLVDNTKVTDHHALIPTKNKGNASLPDDERKLYDLIVRRFIAVFYPPYEYEQTQVHTSVEDENFYVKGIAIKALGWKMLYDQGKEEDSEEEQPLPRLSEGQKVTNIDAEVLKKKTSPPKPYTEATLLSAMEHAGRFIEDEDLKEKLKDSGLGTPATRAATIERLLQVGYITRKGKALMPTIKGMNLIEVVPDELKSPETTGKWERALSNISKGTMPPSKFMGSILRYVNYIVKEAATHKSNIVFPQEERFVKRNQSNSSKPKAEYGLDKVAATNGKAGNAKRVKSADNGKA